MDTLKPTIEINPEIVDLMKDFPLSPEEYLGLEESILEEGCRDPLILWNSILIDGHNRYEICQTHNIEFKTFQKEFDSLLDAKIWVAKNQMSRRNLSPYKRSLLSLIQESLMKEKAKENIIRGARNRHLSDKDIQGLQISATPVKEFRTRKALADAAGVSQDTIFKVKKIQEKASEEIKKQIADGDITINQAYKKINVHVGQNSGENEWYTPKYIIDAARNTMGSIDLDPASSDLANQTVKATSFFTKEMNGLDQDWGGNIWMNPPYSQPLVAEFSKKFVSELPNINQACVLINNATETQWLQIMLELCTAICYLKSRVKFVDMDGNASGSPLQGQLILYFGNNVRKFGTNFNPFGLCREQKKILPEEE